MAADRIDLRVGLAGSGLDEEALAQCATVLGEEIGDLDVDDVSPASAGDAPPGAKGVELLALGAFVVKLARSRQLLGQLVEVIRDWLSRNDAERVRLEVEGDVIEITGASEAERKALIDAWIARHSEP